jgi:hypothetical protein
VVVLVVVVVVVELVPAQVYFLSHQNLVDHFPSQAIGTEVVAEVEVGAKRHQHLLLRLEALVVVFHSLLLEHRVKLVHCQTMALVALAH